MPTVKELRDAYGDAAVGRSDEELLAAYAKASNTDIEVIHQQFGYLPKTTASVGWQTKPPTFEERVTEKAVGGLALGLFVGLTLATAALGRRVFIKWRAGRVAAPIVRATQAHDAAYAEALAEIEENRQDKALWARALVASDGDKSKASAAYIAAAVERRTASSASPTPPRPAVAPMRARFYVFGGVAASSGANAAGAASQLTDRDQLAKLGSIRHLLGRDAGLVVLQGDSGVRSLIVHGADIYATFGQFIQWCESGGAGDSVWSQFTSANFSNVKSVYVEHCLSSLGAESRAQAEAAKRSERGAGNVALWSIDKK